MHPSIHETRLEFDGRHIGLQGELHRVVVENTNRVTTTRSVEQNVHGVQLTIVRKGFHILLDIVGTCG